MLDERKGRERLRKKGKGTKEENGKGKKCDTIKTKTKVQVKKGDRIRENNSKGRKGGENFRFFIISRLLLVNFPQGADGRKVSVGGREARREI